jgi:ABC-type branched-subunit amino acid transport system substrate-binding protein
MTRTRWKAGIAGVVAVVAASLVAGPALAQTSTTAQSGSTGSAPAPSEALATAAKVQKQLDKIFPRKDLKKQSGNTTRGVNGKEINVEGIVAQKQGPDNPIDPFPGTCEGAQARFARANKNKELPGGYTIKYGTCYDDESTPATFGSRARQAVEQDQAFALVPVTSQGFLTDSGNYLNQRKVPYFGYAFMPPYCGYEFPYAFATGGTVSCDALQSKGKGAANDILIGSYLAAVNKKPSDVKVAGIAEDTTSGRPGIQIVKTGVESAGSKMVYAEAPLPFDSDPPGGYKPFAQAMIQSGANLMMIVTSVGKVQKMIDALREAGYTGDIMNFVYSDDRVFLSPALKQTLDKVYTVSPIVGASGNGGPGFEQISNDLKAAGFNTVGKAVPTPVSPTTITSGTAYGYASADFFLEALKETIKTKKKITAENLANTINGGFQYKGVSNAVGPSYWPSGHIIATPTGSAIQADVNANGGKGTWKVVVPLRAFSQEIVNAG